VNTYSRLTPSRSFKKEVNSSVAIYIPGGTVHLNSRSPKIFILSMMWRGANRNYFMFPPRRTSLGWIVGGQKLEDSK